MLLLMSLLWYTGGVFIGLGVFTEVTGSQSANNCGSCPNIAFEADAGTRQRRFAALSAASAAQLQR